MADPPSGYFMQGVDHLYLIFPSQQCMIVHISLRFHMDQVAKLLESKYSGTRERITKI